MAHVDLGLLWVAWGREIWGSYGGVYMYAFVGLFSMVHQRGGGAVECILFFPATTLIIHTAYGMAVPHENA